MTLFRPPPDAHGSPYSNARGLHLVADSTAPSSADFAGLLHSVANEGSTEAFASLFDYFAPRVKTYLVRLGSSDAEAEELAQDVMLSVWQRAASFDQSKAAVSTWIFTIARNRRIDGLRRAGWSPEAAMDIDEMASFLPDPAPATEDEAVTTHMGQQARTHLHSLPELQQEVLRMAYLEEKTHQEISDSLGLPLGTVKSRIRVALQRMHELFAG